MIDEVFEAFTTNMLEEIRLCVIILRKLSNYHPIREIYDLEPTIWDLCCVFGLIHVQWRRIRYTESVYFHIIVVVLVRSSVQNSMYT